MHIDGLMDACRDEWSDTVLGAVEKALEYWDYGDFESDDFDERVDECVRDAMDDVTTVIHWEDALAWLWESGLVYEALRGELDYDNCPLRVMEDEVRDRFKAELEEREG